MKAEGIKLIHPFPEWEHQVRAAFTTRAGGFSSDKHSSLNLGFRSGDDPEAVDRNWNAVRIESGTAGKTLVLPKMAHADVLADADAFPETQAGARIEPEGADAVFSRSNQRILAVTMADCLTALIFDPNRGTIAAVHAGWRGTRLGILGKTLRFLTAEKHINPQDTWVALGPCLRRESLEVGEEVAAQLDPCFLIPGSNGGKTRFDMPGCNRDQALSAGIRANRFRDMGGDTLTEPERYFSYRRDGQASGRMAAFISLV